MLQLSLVDVTIIGLYLLPASCTLGLVRALLTLEIAFLSVQKRKSCKNVNVREIMIVFVLKYEKNTQTKLIS